MEKENCSYFAGTKILAKQWRQLDVLGKQPYFKMYKEDLVRCEIQEKEFNETGQWTLEDGSVVSESPKKVLSNVSWKKKVDDKTVARMEKAQDTNNGQIVKKEYKYQDLLQLATLRVKNEDSNKIEKCENQIQNQKNDFESNDVLSVQNGQLIAIPLQGEIDKDLIQSQSEKDQFVNSEPNQNTNDEKVKVSPEYIDRDDPTLNQTPKIDQSADQFDYDTLFS